MLFQTLDDKKECVGIYSDSNLKFKRIPDGLSKTWSYSPYLKGKDIEYAQLYVNGSSLSEIAPEHLKQELDFQLKKMRSFVSSFIEAKISLKNNCFFDLVPQNFLIDYCEIKNKICEHIFSNIRRPDEYLFFKRFLELLTDIEQRKLNIDLESLKAKIADEKAYNLYKKLINTEKNIVYNMYGTKTGRLTIEKNSFPIQTFPKSFRDILKPQNDWFVSFDMNAAELRTALALLEKDQPEEDLHELLTREVFKNSVPRSEAKLAVTAWLYNSSNQLANQFNDELDNIFEKENLLNSNWDGKYVYTPFNRKIESDSHNAISHLNQSTFIDLFHRQVIKVDDYLQNKKSFIAFLLHDEFVIDICDHEKSYIIDIINILQNTEFGKFLVNVKVGRNFGEMKKLKLKV